MVIQVQALSGLLRNSDSPGGIFCPSVGRFRIHNLGRAVPAGHNAIRDGSPGAALYLFLTRRDAGMVCLSSFTIAHVLLNLYALLLFYRWQPYTEQNISQDFLYSGELALCLLGPPIRLRVKL